MSKKYNLKDKDTSISILKLIKDIKNKANFKCENFFIDFRITHINNKYSCNFGIKEWKPLSTLNKNNRKG